MSPLVTWIVGARWLVRSNLFLCFQSVKGSEVKISIIIITLISILPLNKDSTILSVLPVFGRSSFSDESYNYGSFRTCHKTEAELVVSLQKHLLAKQ